MKLMHLLVLLFVFISGAPLFIGLQYLNNQAGDYARELFAGHLSAMSLIAKKRILTTVDRIKDNTALISSRTQLRLSLAQWNHSEENLHQEKIKHIIHDAKHGLSHIKEIRIYDKHGQLVASTSNRSATAALQLDQAAKAKISLFPDADDVVALSQVPLLLDHETVGYIQILFFTEFIMDLVKDRTGLGETGEWLLAVRHESGDAIVAVPLKYDHKAAFNKRIAKDQLDAPITQALLGNERLMHNASDYRSQAVLASTRYLSELDWGLVAKIDESEVNQLVNQNKTIIYVAEFIIVLLAFIFGAIAAFIIARPIERLTAHTAKVEAGSLEDPPQTTSWKEVKELTLHFSHMLKTLREFNDNLQCKIDEQTQMLLDTNKKLESMATQDPLTGLSNRRKFDECFALEFARAKRYNKTLVAVMLDLDHFKLVNDSYGHAVGDKVLQKIAAYLSSASRDSDLVARLGGEEFCLILPESVPEASLAFLERIRIDISNFVFKAAEKQFSVTCSFGVACLDKTVDNPKTLLHNADTALYQAKESGRNRVVLYVNEGDIS